MHTEKSSPTSLLGGTFWKHAQPHPHTSAPPPIGAVTAADRSSRVGVSTSTPPQLCAQEQAVWWSLYLRFIFLSKLSSCCSILLAYIPGLAREATEKHFCERSEKPLQPEETFGNNLKYHNPHPQQKRNHFIVKMKLNHSTINPPVFTTA